MDLPEAVTLDTNCFLYAFEAPDSARGLFVVERVLHAAGARRLRLVTASLVVAELLVQPNALGQVSRARRLRQALEGLPGIEIDPLTTQRAEEAAELRARLQVALPDAVLLATATALGAPLLTNDRRLATAGGAHALMLDDLVGAGPAR